MQNIISWAAIVGAGVCLLVYLGLTLKVITDRRDKVDPTVQALASQAKTLKQPTVGDLAELVKQLAALVDSLVKAGPALWALIGSLLFLLIGAVAAGVFSGAS